MLISHRRVQRLARWVRCRLAARALLACAACAAVAGTAQQRAREEPKPALVLTSTLERLAVGAGGAALEPTAGTVGSHAEELVFSVAFSNVSGAILDNLRITSAVPADLRYVAGTATGPGSRALFSVDQGMRFGLPEELAVPAASGGTRRADPADYTHVRFILDAPLEVGATGAVRFRVVPR